jgi:tRNA nucleotidyltransferase/poly(A) polymerase
MEAAMVLGTKQFEAAIAVVERLRAAGYEAYLAGGCVRDLLLGREPKDFDVATSATPDVVLGMFERTFAVGAHFGVVLVASEDEDGEVITEVATFRMRCSTQPAPKRTCGGEISRSMGCCWTRKKSPLLNLR